MDDRLSELVAEANDAGYSTAEAIEAILLVAQNQAHIASEDPDPADDPEPICPTCQNARWICEDHQTPWPHKLDDDGKCGAAGVPCPTCNVRMDQKPDYHPEGRSAR